MYGWAVIGRSVGAQKATSHSASIELLGFVKLLGARAVNYKLAWQTGSRGKIFGPFFFRGVFSRNQIVIERPIAHQYHPGHENTRILGVGAQNLTAHERPLSARENFMQFFMLI